MNEKYEDLRSKNDIQDIFTIGSNGIKTDFAWLVLFGLNFVNQGCQNSDNPDLQSCLNSSR
jgi:hypothetical protein